MVRINGSAVRFWLHRSRSLSSWCLGCALVAAGASAHASEVVAIRSANPELEPMMSRLGSELASAGYSVRLDFSAETSACERASAAGSPRTAWVNLALDPRSADSVLATVCFDGATVVTLSPRSDPARFAVTTAEALNGLGAAPPRAAQPSSPAPRAAEAPIQAAQPPPPRPWRALYLAQTLLIDAGDFPLLWGSSLDAELPLGGHFGLVFGGFFPISRVELSSSTADLRVGLAFLRLGPALRYSLGELALSASLVVGPAFTWVTADAASPYVDGEASTVSALGAAGVQLLYPERSAVFALALCRAALLLPGVHFATPNETTRSLGPALFEASLGVGLRL